MFATVLTLLAVVAVGNSLQPCCQGEKKFRIGMGGNIGQVYNGTAVGIQIYYETAMDSTSRQVGGEGYVTVLGTPGFAVKFIQVWSQKKQYTIVNDVCTVKALKTPEPTLCIPSGAQFIGYYTQGNDEFVGQTWGLDPADVGLMDGYVYLSVSNSTCIPSGVGYIGTAKTETGPVSTTASFGYLNYTSGIPDPSRWFDIPSSCTHHQVKASSTVPIDGIVDLLQNLIF